MGFTIVEPLHIILKFIAAGWEEIQDGKRRRFFHSVHDQLVEFRCGDGHCAWTNSQRIGLSRVLPPDPAVVCLRMPLSGGRMVGEKEGAGICEEGSAREKALFLLPIDLAFQSVAS